MFWLLGLLCNSLFFVLGAVMRCFSRVEESERSEPSSGSDSRAIEARQDHENRETETSELGFEFHGDSDTVSSFHGDSDESEEESKSYVLSTSKYQFISGRNISEFVEEPKIMSLTIQEMFVGSDDSADQIPEKQLSGGCNFEADDSVEEEKAEESVLTFSFGMIMEKNEQHHVIVSENDVFGEHDLSDEVQLHSKTDLCPENDVLGKLDLSYEEAQFHSKHDLSGEAQSQLHSKSDYCPENDVLGKHNLSGEAQLHSKYDIFSENDVLGKHDLSVEAQSQLPSKSYFCMSTEHDMGSCEFLLSENVTEDFGCESETNSEAISDTACFVEDSEPIVDGDGSDEYIELDPHEQNSSMLVGGTLSVHDSEEEGEAEEPERQSFDDAEDEDDVGWEFISEHQDLIEQLKIELKNVRIGGLPTILEESESPKIVEDLKPLKIDEKKLEHKDRIEQIQKVYKSYVEKMRKLDILSYQTMHAIGFIRRKDQSGFVSVGKPSTMKFPFLQNLRGIKARMVEDDPIVELERDLELVYVGQACLSWKILRWQYEKAKELCDYDPQGFRQYNEVAGEFQLFQVLVQRYVEDETFQGPRVQHYVKNRCLIRNLLQVPVIRDDKKGRKEEEGNPITSAMLREIIHECMHVFREFIRADKKGTNSISKGLQRIQVELQNPADKTLHIEVQTDLQKKERKLKDILRTGNCIVKKFQKHNHGETRLDHELFIAQVELTLVSRVLNMAKLTTQQLVWCHEQLGKINFTSRKVYLEPSFLLFPC